MTGSYCGGGRCSGCSWATERRVSVEGLSDAPGPCWCVCPAHVTFAGGQPLQVRGPLPPALHKAGGRFPMQVKEDIRWFAMPVVWRPWCHRGPQARRGAGEERLRMNSRDEFDQFIRMHYDTMIKYARGLCGDRPGGLIVRRTSMRSRVWTQQDRMSHGRPAAAPDPQEGRDDHHRRI